MSRATSLSKHRLSANHYAIDFTADLDASETLIGSPTVTVALKTPTGWEDVTDEFAIADETIVGDTVVFTLGAAAAGEQDGGDYYVRVEVDTSNGQHLVSTHPLEVRETADPSAP